MNRTHMDSIGYFALEYMCEFEDFKCPQFFQLLNQLESDHITENEYIDEIMKLELEQREQHPDKFQIGGIVF